VKLWLIAISAKKEGASESQFLSIHSTNMKKRGPSMHSSFPVERFDFGPLRHLPWNKPRHPFALSVGT